MTLRGMQYIRTRGAIGTVAASPMSCLEQLRQNGKRPNSSFSAAYGFGTGLAMQIVKDFRVEQQSGFAAYRQDSVMAHADKTLDIKGLVQPRPAIVIEMTMNQLDPGQVLSVITNDAGAKESVPALCTRRGYALLETSVEGGTFHFQIQKKILTKSGTPPGG
jgi:TusA-related sulfurtransferase